MFHFDDNTFITRIRKNAEELSGVVSKVELAGRVVAPCPADLTVHAAKDQGNFLRELRFASDLEFGISKYLPADFLCYFLPYLYGSKVSCFFTGLPK